MKQTRKRVLRAPIASRRQGGAPTMQYHIYLKFLQELKTVLVMDKLVLRETKGYKIGYLSISITCCAV